MPLSGSRSMYSMYRDKNKWILIRPIPYRLYVSYNTKFSMTAFVAHGYYFNIFLNDILMVDRTCL